jgi:NAD(P)-dependent dehydrogenase (short-subunit alcohol dehydrogenase family)
VVLIVAADPNTSDLITDTDETTQGRPITPQSIADCIATLESLLCQPDALAQVAPEQRRQLLIVAGKLSRPLRHERERVTKAIRRYRRVVEGDADLRLRQATQIRDGRGIEAEDVEEAREFPSLFPPPSGATGGGGRRLNQPQSCYICKRDYVELHHFYDALCPDCAEFNFRKRSQTARLDGRIALVTGARIKIGFHTALMLLRAGARVIATTRFPNDAAARFTRELDYEQWRDRLTVYGLDLRFCPTVEQFAEHLRSTLPRLDFLINNAAQTVQRPPGYYLHLRPAEQRAYAELPPEQQALLGDHQRLLLQSADSATATADLARLVAPTPAPSSELDNPIDFPSGRFDADGQQLDLRRMNSWRLRAADVTTPELIEVHLVNAIAPFILVSRLKQLMAIDPTGDRHVVNVSAMEGVFARRTKTDKHPHTNMAKASLNMLTRTSAADYVRSGIHMNSVDTGWVTDEDPHPDAVRKRRDYDFSPPLDAIDGAARVCDPIFAGFLTGEHQYGQFFKDYRPSEW